MIKSEMETLVFRGVRMPFRVASIEPLILTSLFGLCYTLQNCKSMHNLINT